MTRNSPDAYYLGSHGPEGPAYELASRFAEHLGVALRLYTVRTREAAIQRGRRPAGPTSPRPALTTGIELPAQRRTTAPATTCVREHLVYRRRGRAAGHDPRRRPRARSRWPRAAPTSARSRSCGCSTRTSPGWSAATRDTEEILAEVSRGNVQYTLASSTEFALNRVRAPRTRHRARPVARARDHLGREHRRRTTERCSIGSTRSSSGARAEGIIAAAARPLLRQARPASTTCSRATSCEHLQTPPAALRSTGSRRRPRSTSSTGGCSRRWVTRNRSGTRTPCRSRACAA
ncbi:MAG: hypothetical protein MZW92_09790 [Comamonadaceae bacterium]|nr:hypothetical protein [Comamonadaceae bacterium]